MPVRSEEKREQLKSVILPVAMKAFRLHGIKAVKMDDLAASLKISKRTLYETYSNKNELFLDAMNHIVEENHRRMENFAKSSDNVMDILIEFFRMQIEMYSTTNPQFFSDVQRSPELMEYLKKLHEKSGHSGEAFCQRGVEEGYFRSDVNYELLMRVGREVSQMTRVNPEYRKYDMSDFFYSYVCTILRGVCTDKGLKKIDDFIQNIPKR